MLPRCALWPALFVQDNVHARRALFVLWSWQQLNVRGRMSRGREDLFAEYGVQRAPSHYDRPSRIASIRQRWLLDQR